MPRIRTDLPEVDRALEAIHPTLERLGNHPLTRGTFVDVSLEAGTDTRVAHGLRRPWQGWIVVDTTGTSPVYRPREGNRSTEIWLHSATAAEIRVYVF